MSLEQQIKFQRVICKPDPIVRINTASFVAGVFKSP